MRHYLYRHIRLDKNEPFYIGIGTKELGRENLKDTCSYRRAYEKKGRGDIWNKISRKSEYEVEILLESSDYQFLKDREIEFIKLYGRKDLRTGTLANLTDGGDGTIGIIWAPETILKREQSKRQTINKRGYFHPPESREAIRKSLVDRPCLRETRNIISKKAKERGIGGIKKAIDSRKREVEMYDRQGNLVKIFGSIFEAGEQMKINYKNIQSVCSGRRKTAGNFKWKYKF